MWTPVDITALPTARDLIYAQAAIKDVEIELKDALLALEQAQLRVNLIKQNLWERRAWIAPIRRLSADALSLIFEFCGEDDWRTPLLISEVSRYWREIVLATPRAWAFLRLHDFEGEHQMIYRFFSRSGHCPLHIYLPLETGYPAQILSGVEKRLKCLTTYMEDDYMEDRVFPILERLTLGQVIGVQTDVSPLNKIQFPSLRHFICEANSISVSSGVTQWEFPPLQTLSLHITPELARMGWLSLLNAVKSSLISLRIKIIDPFTPPSHQMTLPALKCLDIQIWHDESQFWPLDLKTPALETYMEFTHGALEESRYHQNTQNVRNMNSNCIPILSSFPLLEILQLEEEPREDSPISAVFPKLVSNASLCPKLRAVELMVPEEQVAGTQQQVAERFDADLRRVNQHRPVPLQLVVSSYLGKELPYAIKDRPCGDGMPCNWN